jgi:limonene-1,2-epoxide hydrolase
MRFFSKVALIGSMALALQGVATSARAGEGDCCDPERVVLDFLASFATRDPQTVSSYLADDVYYTNTGLPTINGEATAETFISELLPLFSHVYFEELSVMSRSNEVLLRRVEHYTVSPQAPIGYPGVSFDLPVMGHYVVENCMITQWNDYWDTASFTRASGIPLPTGP